MSDAVVSAVRNPKLGFLRATAPHHLKAREEQKAEFDSNDKMTRRAVLRHRQLREMVRPWRAFNHVMRYLQVKTKINMTFHQGARIR